MLLFNGYRWRIMRKNKIRLLFLVSLLSLMAISISYAGLQNQIYIQGTVNTTDDFNLMHQKTFLPLDEINTDVTPDESPYKLDGILKPNAGLGPEIDIDGKKNSCLSFDGINDYIEITAESHLDLTDSFTLMAWIKPTEVTSSIWTDDHTIIAKKQSYYLSINDTGFLSFYGYDLTNEWVPSINLLPYLNTWTHLAVTYDGSQLTIFVNGNIETTASYMGSLRQNDEPVTIGWVNYERYYNGFMDDIKIYDTALTYDEIQYYLSTV